MDEQSIREAAVTAVADLQLDCEIKEVRRSGDAWCAQFSGEFGQFCDEFKTQFGKDNSPGVMREKIKGYLLKQVSKIRSKTGKVRRGRPKQDATDQDANPLAAPMKLLGEVFDNVSNVAGVVVGQATNVMGAARELTSSMAEGMSEKEEDDAQEPAVSESFASEPVATADAPAERELTTHTVSRKSTKTVAPRTTKSAKKSRKTAAKQPAKKSRKAATKTGARKSKKAAKRKKE